MNKLLICLLFTVSATAFLSCYIAPVHANAEFVNFDNATSAISQAFNNVLAVETLGGNVTTLLSRLNTAGQFLSQAQNSYFSGNTTGAVENIQNAYSLANEINNQALALQTAAANQSNLTIIQTIALSTVGAVIFVLILLAVWRRIKISYFKRLLDSKIEGAANGT
jgi:hypothetical protein